MVPLTTPSTTRVQKIIESIRTPGQVDAMEGARVVLLHEMECSIPHRHDELAARIISSVVRRRIGQQAVVEIEPLDVFQRVADAVLEFLRAGLTTLEALRNRH